MNKKKHFGELIIAAVYLAINSGLLGLAAVSMSEYLNTYADMSGNNTGGLFTPSAYGIMLRSYYGDIIQALICLFLFVITLACFIMIKKSLSADKEINRAFLYFVGCADILYLSYKAIMSAIGLILVMFSVRTMPNISRPTIQALAARNGLNSLNGLISLILVVSLAVLLWRMSKEDEE
ncbi:MAG: hypothetical protein J6A07_03070 [Firmicutes bacterium]|nr:hypothetical protein [Bacillota bacterium]